MSEKVWAIIPAGGLGLRAKTLVPKQFISLDTPWGPKTLLEITLSKVLGIPFIQGIMVTLPPYGHGDETLKRVIGEAAGRLMILGTDAGKPVRFLEGGSTRQESVYNAILGIPSDVEWLLVHDGSRPFASLELFNRVFAEAKRHLAAIPGIPVTDTIKKVLRAEKAFANQSGEGLFQVDSTVSREDLLAVQTPQAFRADLLRRSHEKAREAGFFGTDDSQLLEKMGYQVVIVPGERSNVKITYPEDFSMFSAMLENDSLKGQASLGPFLVKGADDRTQSRERPGAEGDNLSRSLSNDFSRGWKWRKGRKRDQEIYPVTGFGIDIHPFVSGRKCILGGVQIPFSIGLMGHSDADVLCHAITDAILGALSLGDIGQWFPPDDPAYLGANSLGLLKELWAKLRNSAKVLHVDCTIIAQAPKIMPYALEIRSKISEALEIDISNVSVKATTPEGLGALGRLEGMVATAAVTLVSKRRISRGTEGI